MVTISSAILLSVWGYWIEVSICISLKTNNDLLLVMCYLHICMSYFVICLLKSFPLFLLVCLYIITLQESTRLLISLLLVMCVTNISLILCMTIFFTQCVSSLYNSLWEFNFIFTRSNLSFCCCFHCICFWSSVSSLKNICLPHGSKDLSLHFCKQLYSFIF